MQSNYSDRLGFVSGAVLALGWAGDVGENTAFSDGGVGEELVEFLVVSDGQKNVSGDDSGLLVVLGGVACEFEDLSGQVLEDGGEIDGGASTDSFGVVGVSEESADSTDWELKACSG